LDTPSCMYEEFGAVCRTLMKHDVTHLYTRINIHRFHLCACLRDSSLKGLNYISPILVCSECYEFGIAFSTYTSITITDFIHFNSF